MSFKTSALIAAILASTHLPAAAQLLQLGAKPEANVGVQLGAERPEPRRRTHYAFTYHGYDSGRWYIEHRERRTRHYDPYYDGYDCHTRFRYDWDEYGERVRYTSTFCYDAYDRAHERRGSRITVRIR